MSFRWYNHLMEIWENVVNLPYLWGVLFVIWPDFLFTIIHFMMENIPVSLVIKWDIAKQKTYKGDYISCLLYFKEKWCILVYAKNNKTC